MLENNRNRRKHGKKNIKSIHRIYPIDPGELPPPPMTATALRGGLVPWTETLKTYWWLVVLGVGLQQEDYSTGSFVGLGRAYCAD